MHATVTEQVPPTSTAEAVHEWVGVPLGMEIESALAHLHVAGGPPRTHEVVTQVYEAGPEAVIDAPPKQFGETTAIEPTAPPVQGPDRQLYPERPRLIGRDVRRFPHCAEATAKSTIIGSIISTLFSCEVFTPTVSNRPTTRKITLKH